MHFCKSYFFMMTRLVHWTY